MPDPTQISLATDLATAMAADSKTIFVIYAFSEPPPELGMILREDGAWSKRGTGPQILQVYEQLYAAGVRWDIHFPQDFLTKANRAKAGI